MAILWILFAAVALASCGVLKRGPAIVISTEASTLEDLAAKEVRRYLYLRTGKLLPVVSRSDAAGARHDAIVILTKDHFRAADFQNPAIKDTVLGINKVPRASLSGKIIPTGFPD